jgi:hypothetical protein
MSTAPPEFQRVRSRLRVSYDRFQGGRAVALAWLVTRLLIFALAALVERSVMEDVFHYHRSISALTSLGLGKILNEYPTPVVWMLWLPYGASDPRTAT